MTSPLTWRHAGAGDLAQLKLERRQLTDFICTDPPKRIFKDGSKSHPREWELDAQSGIRDLRIPARPSKPVLLGIDSDGLAAVCQYEYAHDESGTDAFINVIGVAFRARGTGYGGQALDHVLQEIRAKATLDQAAECLVAARVHTLNEPSKKMCESRKFVCVEAADDDGHEYWTRTI